MEVFSCYFVSAVDMKLSSKGIHFYQASVSLGECIQFTADKNLFQVKYSKVNTKKDSFYLHIYFNIFI